jgi:hypothetical protein
MGLKRSSINCCNSSVRARSVAVLAVGPGATVSSDAICPDLVLSIRCLASQSSAVHSRPSASAAGCKDRHARHRPRGAAPSSIKVQREAWPACNQTVILAAIAERAKGICLSTLAPIEAKVSGCSNRGQPPRSLVEHFSLSGRAGASQKSRAPRGIHRFGPRILT